MKTYTLEELKLAQAKGCRIEYQDINRNWWPLHSDLESVIKFTQCRIHPADEWRARLPRLKEGAEWACDGSIHADCRPHVVSELIGGVIPANAGCTLLTGMPVPPEFLHPDELAAQPEVTLSTPAPATTPTDTPETDAFRRSKSYLAEWEWTNFAIGIEKRLHAAEARVAKWEAELSKVMPADFKDWWQNSREEWPEVARMAIEGQRKIVELTDKSAEAALRLRPIAEAGPVPDGMIRLYGYYSDHHAAWMWDYCESCDVTHFIDIYPPQQ